MKFKPVWGFTLLEKILTPRLFISLYPPLLGAGIRVDFVSPDFRELRVRLKPGLLRQNYVGVHFGGSLYAMTDPFYMLMLMKNLGSEYVVWDTAASIRFLKAVSVPVFARFELDESSLQSIRLEAESGKKVIRNFHVSIQTKTGETVAEVIKEVYIRNKETYHRTQRKKAGLSG